jgi:hypothetical protein
MILKMTRVFLVFFFNCCSLLDLFWLINIKLVRNYVFLFRLGLRFNGLLVWDFCLGLESSPEFFWVFFFFFKGYVFFQFYHSIFISLVIMFFFFICLLYDFLTGQFFFFFFLRFVHISMFFSQPRLCLE